MPEEKNIENESLEEMAARLDGEAIEEDEYSLEEVPQQVGPETCEFIAPIIGGFFGIVTPNWNISDAEVNELSKAYGAVIDKYYPDITPGCEVTAILCTIMVVAPRIGTPRVKLQPGKKAEKGAESAATSKKEQTSSQFPPEGVING